MAERWYYAHHGLTLGPFSTAEIRGLAAERLLLPDDLLWPEGADRGDAVAAASALDFAAARPAAVSPDWLGDVRRAEDAERRAPRPPPVPPPWMGELSDLLRAPRLAPGPLPEWMRAPPSLPTPPPLPAAQPPPLPGALRGTAEAMGFDPESGRVLDPEKFKRWVREQQRQRELEAQPAGPAADPFNQARREIDSWIDRDENRPLVLAGRPEPFRQAPFFQELLRRYQPYGPEMTRRLLGHLEFVLANRKKFYEARG